MKAKVSFSGQMEEFTKENGRMVSNTDLEPIGNMKVVRRRMDNGKMGRRSET